MIDTVAIGVRARRFTVSEYYRMAETGILGPDDRVELIEGEVVEMVPIGSRHNAAVQRLGAVLSNRVEGRALVFVQGPVRLSESTEPQPDVAVLRPRADYYAEAHPGPEDVFLLIEVAETSLAYDRDVKVPLYALAGISEVWLVDLSERRVTRYRSPSAGGHADARTFSGNERLSPAAFPDVEIGVEEILGSA